MPRIVEITETWMTSAFGSWQFWAVLSAALMITMQGQAQTGSAPLLLEAKIPLGAVGGRIDHLAIDLKRQRLFVAELGNDSIGIVNLAANRVENTMPGMQEPQGIGYEPSTDAIYVANGGDGSVRILRREDLTVVGRIDLGDDADNVRIDRPRNRMIVGYGKGALAVIDLKSRTKVADIRLKAHPEGFQIDEEGARAYVNVPDAREIAVLGLAKGEVAGTMPTQGHRANFPMALDRKEHRVLIVFRNPARLLVLSTTDNAVVADLGTCGDADDVFVDLKRHRVYVSCGTGQVDVFEEHGGSYQRIGNVGTAPGARTSLFVPELARLFVAVRAAGPEPAAIWVLQPSP
jgi:DNA-binding beta-propeller fold protein YncE